MRIAEITCVFPPYKGGIGNSVRDLAAGLAGHGETVSVFTPDYGRGVPAQNQNFSVRIIKPLAKFGNAAFIPQLLWRLRDADVVHLHLPFLGATIPTLLFCLLHPKKKLTVTYHMDLAGRGFRRIFFYIYKKICLAPALRRARRIVVSSYDYAVNSDIKNYFLKHKEKFTEIPFGIDEHKFYPREKNAVLLKKHFMSAEDKIILFVGALDAAHYFKGLDVLLRALREIADEGGESVKLLAVGDGGLKNNYQNTAELLNLRDRVIFAGNVSAADLPDYHNLADIFVLPSTGRSEAFGLVLLEAAACGKPVVASDLAGVRTVVRNGETGFLAEPGNASDLARKIRRVISDGELKSKMGASARKNILENYTQNKITARFFDMYESL